MQNTLIILDSNGTLEIQGSWEYKRGPLNRRLELLESFLTLEESATGWNFEAGTITIVDLYCPFVDANTPFLLFMNKEPGS